MLSGENLMMLNQVYKIKIMKTVSFTLDSWAQKFGRATTDNVGKRLAIVLDGEIVSAPNINEPITSEGMISDFIQEATDWLYIRSGALPTPLTVVEENSWTRFGEDSLIRYNCWLRISHDAFYKYKIFGLIANTALMHY